ncbi:hypothetical protein [Zobellia galactanivorans]|uniref:Hypothetical membrane protein n=1 Tax=Zobellia galactanivorans (strain DSM 12802 / CCUG 47099 / CIP 106680 / NCIMB 13871 / Dsij) TaxID=63186 RepID=G0L836_ZOBGA|nr:hypothetical protein [Zobellia galactanivorans]CAZ97914.1 Hypothetical membrane protein [Zobellia galactanivorans]
MKKFITTVFLFLVLGMIVGELIARFFVISPDIPKRSIDQWGIQKYIPNQSGKWKGGQHKWQINKLGWPGILPNSTDSLITIIGDSFVENFMNPDSCHQNMYLKKKLPQFNFLEASRSGVNFLEATMIADQLDSLKPLYQLLYVDDIDFKESIVQISPNTQLTQFDISKKKITKAKLKSSFAKNALYTCKFIYYLYSNYWQRKNIKTKKTKKKKVLSYLEPYKILLSFFNDSNRTNNRILVFRPDTDHNIIELCKNMGYKYILLKESKNEEWSFDYDPHWTCFGHKKAALQIAKDLELKLK